MGRGVHPNKEFEAALRHAEARGWRVEAGGSHAWGRMYCPYDDEQCRCGEFLSQVCGVHRVIPGIMLVNSGGLSITAPHAGMI